LNKNNEELIYEPPVENNNKNKNNNTKNKNGKNQKKLKTPVV
jgi:hypothetical protein